MSANPPTPSHRPLSICHSLTASLLCCCYRFGRVASDGFHGKAAHLTLSELKSAFPGPLIGNGGYDGTTANDAIVKGDADAISFGRSYMSNPDLVERLRDNLPLAELPSHKKWFEPSDKTRAGKQRTTTTTTLSPSNNPPDTYCHGCRPDVGIHRVRPVQAARQDDPCAPHARIADQLVL